MAEIQGEKIVVVGFGWVGQANALSLSMMGYSVAFFDTAETTTFHYEDEHETYASIPRIPSLLALDGPDTYYIVAVGDIVSEDRVQDISRIKAVCDLLRNAKGKVILRATVLPQNLASLHFHIYMPEFLHEKNAVAECLTPFYFVIGTRGDISMPTFMEAWRSRAYRSFLGTPEEASYVKYLSNIWNSIRIAFVNEMGDSIGEPRTHEDVAKIERIIDFVLERKAYLRYGRAFDGHCLPKDMRAFIGIHDREGKNVDLLKGAYSSNEHHKQVEARYHALPKVYSFWEYTKQYDVLLGALWRALNDISFMKRIRKELRFVMDAVTVVIPTRSIGRSAELWEKRAQENAAYYANPRTRSGMNVTEKELSETGKIDYEEYIVRDPQLAPLIARSQSATALDFGSGVGRMTSYFAAHFKQVHGLDVSPTMIAFAKKRVDDNLVSFKLYDGGALPYDSGSIDFVFSFATLQHVPTHEEVERYLREFYRVLTTEGYAKIQLRGGRGVKRWEWTYGASYDPSEAIALAKRVGFKVLNHQVLGTKYIWLILQK